MAAADATPQVHIDARFGDPSGPAAPASPTDLCVNEVGLLISSTLAYHPPHIRQGRRPPAVPPRSTAIGGPCASVSQENDGHGKRQSTAPCFSHSRGSAVRPRVRACGFNDTPPPTRPSRRPEDAHHHVECVTRPASRCIHAAPLSTAEILAGLRAPRYPSMLYSPRESAGKWP